MNRKQFRRRTGVYPETFAEMEEVLRRREGRKKKSGRPAALGVAEQLLSHAGILARVPDLRAPG
ncbi:hypothetical protein [Deinococcus hopiensis]|uniref:hypothetical protein n=1 Tax=Deinococcus hopiensis TaxID=309885 RepID=UPI001FEAAAB1|nr:hypothetical protein [Deinococcus hopiensis]